MPQPLDRSTLVTLGIAAVFAAAAGFAAGFVTTFTHRLAPPWGLVAGIVVIAALVAGFRLVFDSRLIAGAAAVGAIAATGLLLLPGAGGVVLVLDDPLGYVWAVAPALLGAAIVAAPRPRRRSGSAPQPF